MSSGDGESGVAVGLALLVIASVALSTVGFVGAAAAQSQQADVVFVFDRTGSMDSVAADLKDEINNVASELEASGVDARYGLVTYEHDGTENIRQPLTSDTAALEDSLDFTTDGSTEDASDAILFSLDELDYRSGAQKIIVVLTDEDDDSSDETRQQAINRLNEEGATLVAVSEEEPDCSFYSCYSEEETLRHMAQEQADNGRWTDINAASFTQIIEDIIGAIEEAAGDTEAEADPEFEVTNASVENTTLHPGESTNVSVTVENTGEGSGVFNAQLSDSMGQSLYSERMPLAPGESEQFTVEVSYDHVGTNAVLINRDVIDRITVERPPLGPDELEVRNASVARSTVAPGETYTVSAVVESTANWRRDAHIEFTRSAEDSNDSSVSETTTLSLAPGEPAEVSHRVTVPDDADGGNLTWQVDGTPAGTVHVLSADEAGTGVVHGYAPATDDGSDRLAVVLRNGGNDTRHIFVNVASEAGAIGTMRMVTVGPGDVVELRLGADELPAAAGDADTWWVNGEPMPAAA